MNFIQWTNSAFNELEVLPEEISFEIIRRVDFLAKLPGNGFAFGKPISESKGAEANNYKTKLARAL